MLMTGRKRLSWLPALVMAAQMTGPGAAAQQAATPVVAVIDVQLVVRESAARRSIRSQIQKQQAIYQEEITRQENELRAAEKELARQKTILAPEAFKERRRSFDQRFGALQRNVENRKRQLERASRTAMRAVRKSLREVVDELAKEKGFTLIFLKSALMFATPDFEITKEVIKRLDARLPSVSVQLPDK